MLGKDNHVDSKMEKVSGKDDCKKEKALPVYEDISDEGETETAPLIPPAIINVQVGASGQLEASVGAPNEILVVQRDADPSPNGIGGVSVVGSALALRNGGPAISTVQAPPASNILAIPSSGPTVVSVPGFGGAPASNVLAVPTGGGVRSIGAPVSNVIAIRGGTRTYDYNHNNVALVNNVIGMRYGSRGAAATNAAVTLQMARRPVGTPPIRLPRPSVVVPVTSIQLTTPVDAAARSAGAPLNVLLNPLTLGGGPRPSQENKQEVSAIKEESRSVVVEYTPTNAAAATVTPASSCSLVTPPPPLPTPVPSTQLGSAVIITGKKTVTVDLSGNRYQGAVAAVADERATREGRPKYTEKELEAAEALLMINDVLF